MRPGRSSFCCCSWERLERFWPHAAAYATINGNDRCRPRLGDAPGARLSPVVLNERARGGPGRLGRFLLVGCTNFAVSFTVFYLLYRRWPVAELLLDGLGSVGRAVRDAAEKAGLGSADAAVANVFGYSAGIVNSFTWNRHWVFSDRGEAARPFRRFVIVNVACLVLSSLSLLVFTDYLEWRYLPVWLVTMGSVTAVNFLAVKHWVFVGNTR